MKLRVLGSLLLVSALIAPGVQAETFYDISVKSRDIVFQPDQPILNEDVQVFVTLRNNGSQNVEGTVIFSIDNKRLGAKPFSIRAAGSPEDVWIRWVPDTLGLHTIRAEVINDVNFPDGNPEDNTVSEVVTVDLDTDKDGIPDRLDKDQDNDGLTNEQERGQSTDPLRSDTDGDGVSDKMDFYPLDRTRSVYVPPPPTPKPATVQKPTVKPTVSGTVVAAPRAQDPVVVGIPPFTVSVSSSEPVVTTTTPVIEELFVTSTVLVVDEPMDVSSMMTTTTPAHVSPYRWLWALAGAAGGAGVGFVALDLWQGRRRLRDDG